VIAPGSRLGLGLQQAAARRPSTEQVRALDQQLFGAAGVLGVVAVGSSAVAAPLAASAAASASPAAVTTVASGASVLSLKVGLVLAVAVSGAVGGTVAWREHRRPPTAPVAERAVPGRVVRSAARPPKPALTSAFKEVPREAPAPAPAATLAAPAPATALAARPESPHTVRARDDSAAAPSHPGRVAAEIALIDEARASSDPTRALQLCRDHERRFAGGFLREEREVVAISALISLGRFAEARDRSARFLQSYPVSAYAASVRDHLREIERR
jgi:hypothetical protein